MRAAGARQCDGVDLAAAPGPHVATIGDPLPDAVRDRHRPRGVDARAGRGDDPAARRRFGGHRSRHGVPDPARGARSDDQARPRALDRAIGYWQPTRQRVSPELPAELGDFATIAGRGRRTRWSGPWLQAQAAAAPGSTPAEPSWSAHLRPGACQVVLHRRVRQAEQVCGRLLRPGRQTAQREVTPVNGRS